MNINYSKRFYLLSLLVLAVLLAYPLVNGVRMAYIGLSSGALEPQQYTKYVVPYAAICVALLIFAALQPLFFKLKRLAFPLGLAAAGGVFLAVERFFETMQIHVVGMTLIDAAALAPEAAGNAATVDIWQAALCIVSPVMQQQSLTYAAQDRFIYVLGDSTYKIHYYLISLILITMIGGLIYGIGKMYRSKPPCDKDNGASGQNLLSTVPNKDLSPLKPLYLRGISTAVLVALCVFANTTAFFRQAAPIQTPLASFLTGLFFVALGAAVGIYTGSFLLGKSSGLGIGLPALLSCGVTAAMYAGEAAMMQGNLYRLGVGWFYKSWLGRGLAPVDILIILLAGGLAGLILYIARKQEKWPGRHIAIAAVALCAVLAATGPLIALSSASGVNDDISAIAAAGTPPPSAVNGFNGVENAIRGCYVFDYNIYTNPLSSFVAFDGLPFVYGFAEDIFIIANTGGGDIQSYSVEYCKTPVGADEFSSKTEFLADWLPNLSDYEERYLLAVMSEAGNPRYGLYYMDGELWLTELRGIGIWSIYRLEKTTETTLADLERAQKHYVNNPPLESPTGIYENPPKFYENQLTLQDVYTLARKGSNFYGFFGFCSDGSLAREDAQLTPDDSLARQGAELTLEDFEPFFYRLSGVDFTARLYEVVGADTVIVRVKEGKLESALLESRRAPAPAPTIDLRAGLAAVAAYLNPLRSFLDIKIECGTPLTSGQELLFEDDYFLSESRYFVNYNADTTYVTFSHNERMTVREALQERRLSIEDAVAHGLTNVMMIPIDNPLGGYFPILHHLHTFSLNGEAFYPSKSFMYITYEGVADNPASSAIAGNPKVYYDIDELMQFLEYYGYSATAEMLRQTIDPAAKVVIANGAYISDDVLAQAGIQTEIGWLVSSSTPVWFSVKQL